MTNLLDTTALRITNDFIHLYINIKYLFSAVLIIVLPRTKTHKQNLKASCDYMISTIGILNEFICFDEIQMHTCYV